MNIVFMGAKQGGMIGLLTLGCNVHQSWVYDHVQICIPYDEIILNTANSLKIKTHASIKDVPIKINYEDRLRWETYDLLVSVHGREIVSSEILEKFKYGGINLHPMLSKYKGANPISRFIIDSLHGKTDNMASVGVHRMTDVLDGGEILSEKFIKIDNPWEKSPAEIYNELYPLYPLVLMEAIQKVCD